MAERISIVAVSIAAFLTAINQISIIITAKQLWMQQQQLQQQLERLQKERSATSTTSTA
nr:MAG TPA: cell division protein [Caudoviricetes sp.]